MLQIVVKQKINFYISVNTVKALLSKINPKIRFESIFSIARVTIFLQKVYLLHNSMNAQNYSEL